MDKPNFILYFLVLNSIITIIKVGICTIYKTFKTKFQIKKKKNYNKVLMKFDVSIRGVLYGLIKIY